MFGATQKSYSENLERHAEIVLKDIKKKFNSKKNHKLETKKKKEEFEQDRGLVGFILDGPLTDNRNFDNYHIWISLVIVSEVNK